MYRTNATSRSSRSRAGTGIESTERPQRTQLGTLPATALERPDAIEDFKNDTPIARSRRPIATWPGSRHVCNWAIGRDLLTATPFHRRGASIATKNERRRDRRVSEAEEQRLLDACKLLNESRAARRS